MNSKFLQPQRTVTTILTPDLFHKLLNQNKNNATNIKLFTSPIRSMSVLFTNNANRVILIKASVVSCYQQKVWSRGQMRGGPGYTNFAHGRKTMNLSKYGKFYLTLLFTGFFVNLFFDYDSFFLRGRGREDQIRDSNMLYADTYKISPGITKGLKAKEIQPESKTMQKDSSDDSDTDKETSVELAGNGKHKSAKTSFRDRKIIQYENRIRMYSTPDKVFRYFATLKVWNEKLNDYEVFMTPDDFIRSLTIGAKQPEKLGLDSFNKFDPNMQKLELKISENSVFKTLGQQGLISFSDYMFLTTLLLTPTRHFAIAFPMFDLDGNGNIDLEEFEQLQAIIRNRSALGQRHKDTYMTGSVIRHNSSLNEHFFGHDLKIRIQNVQRNNFQVGLKQK